VKREYDLADLLLLSEFHISLGKQRRSKHVTDEALFLKLWSAAVRRRIRKEN
jgi:hypothetical protein